MNSFAFFASILAQAISAMPITSSMLDMQDMFDVPFMPPMPKMLKILISATIKDKKHYLLSNQQFKCDGNSRFTITLPNAKGQTRILLFKLTHGKYVKSKRNKKLSKAKYKIKKVSFTSNNKNPKYSVYIIPPKVSRRTAQGKPHKLNVDIQADFECRDKNNNIQRKVYNIPVAFTSNART
ncbi:hypothetical protein DSO57_1035242 [Entomophthora muscae]|uniref:Uncharacterized protein n=1 Tax=Entomophthora muscae TaxID=34485 RepID=A0ACC2UK94_9FUNG|nr:hypothetical protein DSO57_1035242 [Entomophthora muscae]